MHGKYYWRTSLSMTPIILENGFIAPDAIYKSLLGQEISVNAYDNCELGYIILYSNLPLTKNADMNGPMIFAIDEKIIDMKYIKEYDKSASRYLYPLPIFISPQEIEILIPTEDTKKALQSRISGSAEIKWADRYNIRTALAGHGQLVEQTGQQQDALFTPQQEKSPIAFDDFYHKIRISDALAGTYVALIIGCLHEKAPEQRDFMLSWQKVRDVFAGAKSELEIGKSNELNNDMPKYKELLIQIENLLKNVDDIQPDDKNMDNFIKQVIELPEVCGKCTKNMVERCRKRCFDFPKWHNAKWHLLGYFKKNPLQWCYRDDPQIPRIIELIYPKEDFEWKDNISKIESDMKEEPLFIVYKLWELINYCKKLDDIEIDFKKELVMLWNIINEQFAAKRDMSQIKAILDEFFVDHAANDKLAHLNVGCAQIAQQIPNDYHLWQIILPYLWTVAEKRTKNDIKKNGWQYEQRMDFVNSVQTSINRLENNIQYQQDIDVIKRALDSQYEGSAKIDDMTTPVLKNLYAFLYKYDDLEGLDHYLIQRNLSHSYFAWSFWGGLYGFSALPKKYVDPVATDLCKDIKKMDKKIEELRTFVWSQASAVNS